MGIILQKEMLHPHNGIVCRNNFKKGSGSQLKNSRASNVQSPRRILLAVLFCFIPLKFPKSSLFLHEIFKFHVFSPLELQAPLSQLFLI